MIDVAPGTIVLYGDVVCPWATLAVHRLHRTRSRLGLDDRLRLDLRAFPLERFNERPTPRLMVDAELPVVGALAGIRMHWEGPKPGGFPVIEADDPSTYEDLVKRAAGR